MYSVLLLLDFNESLIFSTDFRKGNKKNYGNYSNGSQIVPGRQEKEDGPTDDTTKLTGDFCSYTKAYKIIANYKQLLGSVKNFNIPKLTVMKTHRTFVRENIMRNLISGFRIKISFF
jgi:hypothetical protein